MTCRCGKPLKNRARLCIVCFTRDRKARELDHALPAPDNNVLLGVEVVALDGFCHSPDGAALGAGPRLGRPLHPFGLGAFVCVHSSSLSEAA